MSRKLSNDWGIETREVFFVQYKGLPVSRNEFGELECLDEYSTLTVHRLLMNKKTADLFIKEAKSSGNFNPEKLELVQCFVTCPSII
jgi:hypothetical protein